MDAQSFARRGVRASQGARTCFSVRITSQKAIPGDRALLMIAGIGGLSVLLQLGLIAAGAWPATFPTTFATLILIGAIINKQARIQRHEDVVIKGCLLDVTRDDRGHTLSKQLKCFNLQIKRYEDPDAGLVALRLYDGEAQVEVAADLGPAERETFYQALVAGLEESGFAPEITRLTAASFHSQPTRWP